MAKTRKAQHASLLSEYADSLLRGDQNARLGFWKRLTLSVKGFLNLIEIEQGQIDKHMREEDYLREGFSPFCEISKFRILVRPGDSKRHIIILKSGVPYDVNNFVLQDYAGHKFKAEEATRLRVLAAMYIEALHEDSPKIDQDEAAVIIALARFLGMNEARIAVAKDTVYGTLLHKALEDCILTQAEADSLIEIRRALALSSAQTQQIEENCIYSIVQSSQETLGNGIVAKLLEVSATLFARNPPVVLKAKETAYWFCRARVVQQKTVKKTHRAYAGTRVRVGKLPVYLGGSTPITTEREVMKTIGSADFVLTNKRIIVSGTKTTYNLKIEKIVDIEVFTDAVQVMYEGRYSGRFYMLSNPGFAGLMIRLLLTQSNSL